MEPTRVRFSALYAAAAIVLLCALAGFGPAERHARGSVWLHRGDGCVTTLHADGDPLCELEFPSRCWGGMMSPDSLFCRFWTAPPESLPPPCLFAYHCSVQDPSGRSMMSGHMMGDGFFRQPIGVTLHFDAAALRLQGVAVEDLALVIPHDGAYQVVDTAANSATATFRFDTARPAAWYGIVVRRELAATSATWSEIKTKYRH